MKQIGWLLLLTSLISSCAPEEEEVVTVSEAESASAPEEAQTNTAAEKMRAKIAARHAKSRQKEETEKEVEAEREAEAEIAFADDAALREGWRRAGYYQTTEKYTKALTLYKELLEQSLSEGSDYASWIKESAPYQIQRVQEKIDSSQNSSSTKVKKLSLNGLYREFKEESELLLKEGKYEEAIRLLFSWKEVFKNYQSDKDYGYYQGKILELVKTAQRNEHNVIDGSKEGSGFSTFVNPFVVIHDYALTSNNVENINYDLAGDILDVESFLAPFSLHGFIPFINKPILTAKINENYSVHNKNIIDDRNTFKLHTLDYEFNYSGFTFGNDLIDSLRNIVKIQDKHGLKTEIYVVQGESANDLGARINPDYTFYGIWDSVFKNIAWLSAFEDAINLSLKPQPGRAISHVAAETRFYEEQSNQIKERYSDIIRSSTKISDDKYILSQSDFSVIFPTKIMGELFKCELKFSVEPDIVAYHILHGLEPYSYILDEDGSKHFGIEYLTGIELESIKKDLPRDTLIEMANAIYDAFDKKFPSGLKYKSDSNLKISYNYVNLDISSHPSINIKSHSGGYASQKGPLKISISNTDYYFFIYRGALDVIKGKLSRERVNNSTVNDDI